MKSMFYNLCLGALDDAAQDGVGVCSMGVFKPAKVMRNILPVIMAGILGIYGLIASIVMLQSSISIPTCFPLYFSYI